MVVRPTLARSAIVTAPAVTVSPGPVSVFLPGPVTGSPSLVGMNRACHAIVVLGSHVRPRGSPKTDLDQPSAAPDSRQNADGHFVAEAPGETLFGVALVRVVPHLNRASFLDEYVNAIQDHQDGADSNDLRNTRWLGVGG